LLLAPLGGAIVLMEMLQLPISRSAGWHAIASWFYSLAVLANRQSPLLAQRR
jgi:hypothetical protein